MKEFTDIEVEMRKRINTCIVPESTSVITISLLSTFMIINVTFISILILKCIAKKDNVNSKKQ